MDQHPVPQNISSYEFRLVGDMTLKQFFQLAGGVLAAIIIYRFPLIGLLKWPLMGLSVLIGVLLAFVPVNGRPFSQWVMAFIRAIYSPTEFAWSSPPPSPLEPQNPPPTVNPPPSKPPTPLDILESQLFSKFSTLFQQIHPILTSPSPQPQKPPSPVHLPPAKPPPPPVPTALPAVLATSSLP
ncbi:MAG: PrgI family protein [Patescibacteria group bacterium]